MPPWPHARMLLKRELGATGWPSLCWPLEYGSAGRPIREQFLVEKQVALPGRDAIARVIVAPELMDAGNTVQKKKYLPALARGEVTFLPRLSEPFPCLQPVEDIEEGR